MPDQGPPRPIAYGGSEAAVCAICREAPEALDDFTENDLLDIADVRITAYRQLLTADAADAHSRIIAIAVAMSAELRRPEAGDCG